MRNLGLNSRNLLYNGSYPLCLSNPLVSNIVLRFFDHGSITKSICSSLFLMPLRRHLTTVSVIRLDLADTLSCSISWIILQASSLSLKWIQTRTLFLKISSRRITSRKARIKITKSRRWQDCRSVFRLLEEGWKRNGIS
jgi:hypothetical protein